MFHKQEVKVILVQLLMLMTQWPQSNDCLIITSVLAGDKKFKTISFDSKFLKPLMFEKELPSTEFRRHRTLRPPKFDIDVNIPIKLPLEEEYPKEEYKKPVESEIFFQTGEIKEPSYGKKSKTYQSENRPSYGSDMNYAASSNNEQQVSPDSQQSSDEIANHSGIEGTRINARTDNKELLQQQPEEPQQESNQMMMVAQESSNVDYPGKKYQESYGNQQEFIPGGFVNLQLSGPSGGPKMTYEDYDREKWAQQLSQTAGAMPYPILNYQQLQNFYGGLGTFTNGLAENRYLHTSLMDKLKSGLSHFTNKFHIG